MTGFDVDEPPLTASATIPPIVEGDDVDFDITFTNENDDPYDISSWTVWVTVKDAYSDSDDNALIQQSVSSHDDAANGKTTITFDNSETEDISGTKVWDLQVVTGDGDVRTVVRGTVSFVPDVTNSTS